MHVALVSPGWPIGVPNGIVTYVHHLRNGLLSLGHRVTVLAFVVQPCDDMAGVHCIVGSWRTRTAQALGRLSRNGRNPLAWPPLMVADTLMRVHRGDPIDVVEMEESFGWFADVQRRVSMPVVAKLHGPAFLTQVEQTSPAPELAHRIECEGAALQQARFVYAPAADTIARTFDRYGITHLPRVVIPNPIETPSDARNVWSVANCDPQSLLFVGRFDRIKGGDFLLRAFRIMLDTDPSLRLVFVGPSDGVIDCDGKQRTISDCIEEWFGPEHRSAVDIRGPVPAAAIQELRVRAALTLVCSRWENQPNTALEAMAQGCPVVAVGVGGIKEVIESGETGVLTPPTDRWQFAQAALSVLDNLNLASAIGEKARAYVARVHMPSRIAARTADFYDAALRDHRRAK